MKRITLALLFLLTVTVRAQEAKYDGEYRVVLWGGLVRNDSSVANIIFELECVNGRWQRAYGLAQNYNNAAHEGIITRAALTDGQFRFRLEAKIGDDQWVKGGHAGYDLVMTRDAKGNLTGTFDGHFNGIPAKGPITGEVKPERAPPPKDFVPVDPDEHPRVLFRKRDLPALRAKLQTPFGQKYLAKASEKTGLAPWDYDLLNISVLYQLTGEAKYAEASKLIVERLIAKPDAFVTAAGGSAGFGDRILEAALALDLCWDGWPSEFRDMVIDRIRTDMPNMLNYLISMSGANTHPCSNFYGPGFGGPAVASLVLWGLKGDEPPKPVDPFEQARPLKPPADFKPGQGVPVVDFVKGQMPSKWLLGGPTLAAVPGDPVGGLGGSGQARPEAGVTSSQFMVVEGKPKSMRITFDPMADKFMTANGVDLVALAGGTNGPVTVALFAALRVAEEQTIALVRGQRETQVWLGGAQLNEVEYYKISPGVYPLMITHTTAKATGVIAPLLTDADHPKVKSRREKYEMELAIWKLDHDYWEQTGGRDARLNWALYRGRQRMYAHYRLGIGDGGWQAEAGPHYSDIAMWYPLHYAVAYYKMFGRSPSAYPDVTHVIPRRMMQVVFFNQARKPAAHSKGNDPGAFETEWTAYQPLSSSGGFKVEKVAAGWPIVPDQYKPAILWGWNKVAGDKLLDDAGLRLVNTFLHYPVDMKPEEPAKVMPLTWQAPTFGFECFRNAWKGDDDFVGQVFAKASLIKGWNHPDAGTFRLYGLGHPWVAGSYQRIGFREQETCVLLPLDETSVSACGKYTHRQVWPDGSGTVTIDLKDVYAQAGSPLYDNNLLRLPDGYRDSGIHGLRAIAFDYSGKSGAPCLFVLVDKITGGKERWWQWALDGETISKTKATPTGFVIDQGDATMVATFITPNQPKIDVATEEARIGKIGDGHRSFEGAIHRVRAIGNDHFFVVATIQRKDTPAVKVEGTGLDAKVTVGNQTVRFDGEKIILGN